MSITEVYIDDVLIDRPAERLVLNRLVLSLDAPDALEFTEVATSLPGSWGAGSSIRVEVDRRPVFRGQVVGSYPQGMGRRQIDVGYRALGLTWRVNTVFITSSGGSGRMVYNLPTTEQEDYVASQSGRSVGSILTDVFNLHWPQLTAVGVTAFSEVELDALTVVPPEPVVLTGRLWNAVLELLATWQPQYAAWIDGYGIIRVQSQRELPRRTLRLDDDPITLDAIARDHSECWTRAVVRGADDVQGAYLSLADETLVPAWTEEEQAAWSIYDYYMPRGSADQGVVTMMDSTTLTVTSDDPDATFDANELSTLNAEVWAYNPIATGITFSEQRRVTANTALAAGGSMTITVDTPFANAGYTRYAVRGRFAPQSLVWRKYTIAPTYVAQHLATKFSHSQPWSPTDGVVAQVTAPQAVVCWSPTGEPPYIEFPATYDIIPYDGVTDGYIVFHEPVVKPFGAMANLQAGGAFVDGIPLDIKVLVPYSRGAITAEAPAGGGYAGTAYTVDGVERTLYRDYVTWLDTRDVANYERLAAEVLATVQDTVVEGQVTYHGRLDDLLPLGYAIDIAGTGYTTGYEDIAAPVRTVCLEYDPGGGGQATPWTMRLGFSSRLRPFAGDRLYVHPAYGQQAAQAAARTSWAAVGYTAAAMQAGGLLGADVAATAAGSFGGVVGAFGLDLAGPDEVELPGWVTAPPGPNTYRGPRRSRAQRDREEAPERRTTDPMDAWYEDETRRRIIADQEESMRRYRRRQAEREQAEAARARRGDMTDRELDEHLRWIAAGGS